MKKSSVNIEAIRKYIRKYPNMSYAAFKKATTFKISDCYYYVLRHQVSGKKRQYLGKRTNTFVNVFTAPMGELLNNPKKVLKDFIDVVNQNYANLQLLEYPDRQEIEVREIR